MSTKSLVIAIIAAGSVAAAATGGYVALRVNQTEAARGATVTPASLTTTQAPAASPAPASDPVVPSATDPAASATPASAPPAVTSAPASASTHPVTKPRAAEARAAASRPAIKTAERPVSDGHGDSDGQTRIASASATPPASPPLETTAPAREAVSAIQPAVPDTPKVQFESLVVKEDSVIGIRLESAISSATAHVEDKVSARVSRDVTVGGRTAIPSGATLEGTVVLVEHGGKFKERARVGVRFDSVLLSDGTRVPIQTDTIFRDGDSPTGEAASKVGGSAVVGAILGAVIGGKKGAAIGSTVGAAGGTAAVMAGKGNDAVIDAGTPLTVRLTAPVTVTIEKSSQ